VKSWWIKNGPNGAGKSTVALAVLQIALGVTEFVNADEIARGLSPFNPEGGVQQKRAPKDQRPRRNFVAK
jgi:predicted ABC-type ATPase